MQISEVSALEKRLETLTKLMAIALVNGKNQKEQIRLLSMAGIGPKEIADLIGTTPNTVNVALTSLRKGKHLNLKSEGAKDDV